MTKKTHQIFFAAIIISLISTIFFVQLSVVRFVLCTLSLTAVLILPFGSKGGVYHRAVSSLGLIMYIAVLIIEN